MDVAEFFASLLGQQLQPGEDFWMLSGTIFLLGQICAEVAQSRFL